MSYVLIDNSTLTSVQRLTGDIEVSNKNVIESDILATENLIQAILFHDKILAIDDYKEEYRENRKEKFHHLQFINPDEYNLNKIYTFSREEANKYRPEIKAGEFSDENFRKILELLKLNMVTTWDIASSEYFLNLKLLGYRYDDDYDKYNQISSAIFDDFFYNQTDKADFRCTLVDSRGNLIDKGYSLHDYKWGNGGKTGDKLLTRQLWSFIAALNWIAYRSILYTNIARYLRADIFLHPIRQSFNIHHMRKTNNYDTNFVSNLLSELKSESVNEITIIKQSMTQSINTIPLPFFSFWLVKETGDSRHIVDKAYSIRERRDFIDAREQLAELNNLIYEEENLEKFSVKSQKIKEYTTKTIHSIRSSYGLNTHQGIQLNHIVKVISALLGTEAVDIFDNKSIKLPEFMMTKPKGLNLIYRDITEDLSKIARYGEYFDLLVSNVKFQKDREEVKLELKCEEPRFRYHHSDFKSPM